MRPLRKSARFALMLLAAVSLSFGAGCHSQNSCIKPTLPLTDDPIMQEVATNDAGGLDDENSKALMINLMLYRGALMECNSTIQIYNLTNK